MEEQKNIDFAECLGSILADVTSAYPDDRLEFIRDSKRITQQSRSRGLPFFTIELPELGKQLDRSLSSGRLQLEGLPNSKGKKSSSKIPKLFLGLWLRIFDQDGLLKSDADPSAVFFLRELLYVGKKVELECAPKYLFETTKEFFHVEAILPEVDNHWYTHDPLSRSCLGDLSDRLRRHDFREPELPFGDLPDGLVSISLLETCQRVADRIASSFGYVTPDELIPRNGPGVASDRKTRFFDRYKFLYWSDSLQVLFPFDQFGLLNCSEGLADSLPVSYPVFRDWHSKLVAVPKTQKGPRLIAAEPHCNQWIQQSIARWVREKSVSTLVGKMVNFFDQQPSREAALAASITGLRATIDLKSASDRLTPWLIQRIFRSNPGLVELFRACRTKYMWNSIDKKFPNLVRLRKFATQGSALTFPLQSIVFSTLCLGVAKHLNPKKKLDVLAREIRVFGDDIIVPSAWVPTVKSLLEALWLKVNTTKTHSEGNFRESCGMDAFRGYDVTPAYITSLQTKALDARLLQGAIDVQNHFYLKGLWHTASHLQRTVPQVNKFPVVSPEARVPGLITLCKKGSYYARQNRVRFNQSLQRVENFLPIFRGRSLQVLRGQEDVFRVLHRMEERDHTRRFHSKQLLGSLVRGVYPSDEILESILGERYRLRAHLAEKQDDKGFASLDAPAVVRWSWVPAWAVGETAHAGEGPTV